MSRVRLSALLIGVVGALGLTAGACAAPSTPTTGGWPSAGCIDGAGTDGNAAPDLKFSGAPNVLNNATISGLIGGGGFSISGNGTCTGQPVAAITIVRAADQAAADAVCAGLGVGTATSFTGSAWTLPADAWSCSVTNTL